MRSPYWIAVSGSGGYAGLLSGRTSTNSSAHDKSLVEFKLASNTGLERNLAKQVEIYKKANQTKNALTAIVFFSLQERKRVRAVLERLKLEEDPDILLIDARRDNKVSGSKA